MNLSDYEASETLRDGRTIYIRAIRPDDKAVLIEGFSHLSDGSVQKRFFASKNDISDNELSFYTEIDYLNHFALVAFTKADDHDVLVGGCRYIAFSESDDDRRAEVAFAVTDAYQGLGVATLLFKHIIKAARLNGIKEFVADVLVENKGMRKIFEKSGLPIRSTTEAGVLHVFLALV
jgi:RimJ/RimL family protein N-acetyltransferase